VLPTVLPTELAPGVQYLPHRRRGLRTASDTRQIEQPQPQRLAAVEQPPIPTASAGTPTSRSSSTMTTRINGAGIEPAPRRSELTSRQFLAAQAQAILAVDVARVDTVFLCRLYILVLIEHGRRRVNVMDLGNHAERFPVLDPRSGQQVRDTRVAVAGRVGAVTEETAAARPGVGALLRDLDQAPPIELVDVCARWLARRAAAQACVLLLADYAEASLEPVAGGPAVAHIRPQDLMDSAAGEAYREQRRLTAAWGHAGEAAAAGAAVGGAGRAGGPTLVVYLPVSVRAERLGVLAVTLPGHDLGPDVGEVLDDVARVLGHVLTGARRYTDRFEMLRRRRELGLAAEIRWELLPSLAFELPAFSIGGTVEPAYEIGGDNFDYAISAHRLTVSVSDAVGHGIRAALLASLAVTAMRNARRAHCSIVEQAGTANRHLVEQFPRRRLRHRTHPRTRR
jgi:hypothetical protein